MPMGQNACTNWQIYAVDSVTNIRTEILHIDRWDAHWRKKYDFINPVHISKTNKIFAVASYNNSESNPAIAIVPTKKIKYGEGERDELFLVQYDFVELEE
jgi:hypothetical protein